MRQLVFLGTGHGMPIKSNCTSIMIEDDQTNLLLDTSGGHEILRAFHEASKNPADIQNIFLSHWDSDHILGIVPLMRVFMVDAEKRKRTVYCSKDVMLAVEGIFSYTSNKHLKKASEFVNFEIVEDGVERVMDNWRIAFFDLGSTKTPQLGCVVGFADGKKLSFLGDEPLKEHCEKYVHGSDVVLHEAFCTSDDEEEFNAYAKHHSTAKDAGRNAARVHAKTLALIHMEDVTLATRKQSYLADAKSGGFAGLIFVPEDLDRLEF